MFRLIENLRGKSETYRHVVALSASFVITLGIFAVWATAFFPNAIPGKPIVAENDSVTEEPLNLFLANTSASFGAIKTHWNSIVGRWGETKYEARGEIEIISPEEAREMKYR